MALSTIDMATVSGAQIFTDTAQAATAVSVKGSSGVIYEIQIDNTMNAAQDNYVKLYNTAGAVTVGTTVPDWVIEIRQNVLRNFVIPQGVTFETGIAIATVTTGGTSGTTAPGSALTVRIVYV